MGKVDEIAQKYFNKSPSYRELVELYTFCRALEIENVGLREERDILRERKTESRQSYKTIMQLRQENACLRGKYELLQNLLGKVLKVLEERKD